MKISQAITASSIAIMAITPMIRQTFQVYLALLICGCQGNPPPKAGLPTQKNQPITLRVAAATDLQPWLGDTISEWGTKQVPSINVQTIYGSSGQLAAQIRAGAPVDLFLTADIAIVEQLSRENLAMPESVKTYALGRLAVIFHKAADLKTWTELDKPEIKRLVIANPETAPYGRAARATLKQAGVWEKISKRVVVAESVRQALQQVISGNAETGIVSLGQAREAVQNHSDLNYLEIPERNHPPINQGLAVVNHADQSEPMRKSATELADWILSPAATPVFKNHGLNRP
jgi:molybdate transport system substrate-binding protein